MLQDPVYQNIDVSEYRLIDISKDPHIDIYLINVKMSELTSAASAGRAVFDDRRLSNKKYGMKPRTNHPHVYGVNIPPTTFCLALNQQGQDFPVCFRFLTRDFSLWQTISNTSVSTSSCGDSMVCNCLGVAVQPAFGGGVGVDCWGKGTAAAPIPSRRAGS